MVRAESLTRVDAALLSWLQAHSTPVGHTIARAVTRLGSPDLILTAGLLVAVILAARRETLLLQGWIIALVGGEVLNAALKRIIQRPRPPHSVISSPESWSFPSGHAMESLIGYGMAAYLIIVLVPAARARRGAIVLAAASLIVAIGFSRMYLGVHYFSDVIGGYTAGGLWLAMSISGVELARGWQSRDRASRWEETA
ncbi:MAG TPA: phosphatase PAP2 family protein [Gemmatimonadales bacterium]|nr:phosphatase PAP2 family protein [Gemmatimonadales bacterium]